ncbi:spindle pole body-associated protein sad1 [Diaporthe eres]|nr:spindle pole body-associated protein sad1 [Diaporthe eres]
MVIISWLLLILLELYVPATGWEGIEVGKKYQYRGNSLVGWRQNILQFVPWIVLHPFAVLTGNLDYADYRNTLHWLSLHQGRTENRVDNVTQAVGQLRRILPELIKVDAGITTSEWKVEDEFWHALNDEMKKGGLMRYLLSIRKQENGSYTISDTHWDAIKQRLRAEDLLGSSRSEDDPLALSNEVMSYVDTSISKSFQDWLIKNADAVRKAQGEENGEPSASYTDLFGQVDKAVAARLERLELEARVVTREEFISKIEEYFRDHSANVKGELTKMNEKLGQALGIAMEAKNSAHLPPGLSRTEVESLVAEMVRRAVAEAQLEALAKGSIKSHLSSELFTQKNYFSTIRGALIDPKLTSASFDWRIETDAKKQGVSTTSFFGLLSTKNAKEHPVFRRGGKYTGIPFAPSIALEKWEEDGECWCGGHKEDTHTVDLSIFTAEVVIPQYLVVEHIDRDSTFDPDSMPKDIEFWIKSPGDSTQRSLIEWSKKKWTEPPTVPGVMLMEKGFVKVGQFEFDSGTGKSDTQVFKLPNELVDFGVQTQQVLVRANSNYGASDHTCFYRLRLFGSKPAGGESKPEAGDPEHEDL